MNDDDLSGASSDTTLPTSAAAQPAAASAPLERRAVPEADLLRWMSAQLQLHLGCRKAEIVGLTRVDRPGTDGCNWSHAVVVEPNGTPAAVYAEPCAAVVEKARRRFDVE